MIALAFAAFAQSYACPVGFLAHGVPPTGDVACYVDTDAGVRLVSRARLRCRRGAVPVVQLDGRSARCRHLGASA